MSAFKDKHGRWRFRFARRGIRYHGSTAKGNNTKAAAERLERAMIEKLERNVYTGVMPTVSAFVERFLEYQKARVKPLTYELNEHQLRTHVEPSIGRKPLDAVSKMDLDHLVTKWKIDAAPRTINARLGTVARMFSVAVEWKIIASGPDMPSVKVPKDSPRFLSESEAVELIAAAKYSRNDATDWHAMIIVGLRTGLRVGELRGLQWADIDLARAAVHVQRTDPGRPDLEAGSTKGGRTRVVPLTPDAIEVLRARLDETRERLGSRWAPSSFVWPMRSNPARSCTMSSCGGAIIRLAKKAKLSDVGWHTLRHTYASWLVMRGVPLTVVQQLLGHFDIKQTMRYAHLAPGFAHASAVAALDMPLVGTIAKQLPPGEDE